KAPRSVDSLYDTPNRTREAEKPPDVPSTASWHDECAVKPLLPEGRSTVAIPDVDLALLQPTSANLGAAHAAIPESIAGDFVGNPRIARGQLALGLLRDLWDGVVPSARCARPGVRASAVPSSRVGQAAHAARAGPG